MWVLVGWLLGWEPRRTLPILLSIKLIKVGKPPPFDFCRWWHRTAVTVNHVGMLIPLMLCYRLVAAMLCMVFGMYIAQRAPCQRAMTQVSHAIGDRDNQREWVLAWPQPYLFPTSRQETESGCSSVLFLLVLVIN